MARIRTIKPEFPQSESMGRVSRDARLLFVELWTICDDHGRARAHSRMLASLLFPYDDDAGSLMPGWLKELEDEGCIRVYEAGGSQYLQVVGWSKHQKIDRPSNPQFPPPDDEPSRALASIRESSSGEGIKDQGREGKGEERASAEASPAPPANPSPKPKPAKSARPTKHALPVDFGISDAVREWATSKGYTRLDEHLEAFRSKSLANGYAYADWDAAFREAIRGDWAKLGAAGNGGTSSPVTPPAAPHRKRLGEGSSTDYGIPGIGTPYAARAAS